MGGLKHLLERVPVGRIFIHDTSYMTGPKDIKKLERFWAAVSGHDEQRGDEREISEHSQGKRKSVRRND